MSTTMIRVASDSASTMSDSSRGPDTPPNAIVPEIFFLSSKLSGRDHSLATSDILPHNPKSNSRLCVAGLGISFDESDASLDLIHRLSADAPVPLKEHVSGLRIKFDGTPETQAFLAAVIEDERVACDDSIVTDLFQLLERNPLPGDVVSLGEDGSWFVRNTTGQFDYGTGRACTMHLDNIDPNANMDISPIISNAGSIVDRVGIDYPSAPTIPVVERFDNYDSKIFLGSSPRRSVGNSPQRKTPSLFRLVFE